MRRWLQRLLGLIDKNGLPVGLDYKVLVPDAPQHKLINDRYRVAEAFVIDGVKYFHFPDLFNVPAGRYMAVYATYEEFNMRCDANFLGLFTRAIENILSQKKINLQVLAQLNLNLKERLELMPTEDFIYKLCSVLFFDETEALHDHDWEYAKVKIARWKKDPATLSFFLSKPIAELMPSLNMPVENLPTSLAVAGLIEKIHLRHLTEALSQN